MENLPEDWLFEELENGNLPSPTPSLLELLSEPSQSLAEPSKNENSYASLTNSNNETSVDYSVPSNSSFSSGSQFEASNSPFSTSPESNNLDIIAQPYIQSKLRTFADNEKEKRRNTLKTKTKGSPFTGPALRIPKQFLDSTSVQHYVGIALVTLIHEKSNCRYFHPYELKDIDTDNYNDQSNKIVWYPIKNDTTNGILCFRSLRIDKKLEAEVKEHGPLLPFFGNEPSNSSNDFIPDLSSGRKIIQEYNLKKMQLVFMIAMKTYINNELSTTIYNETLVYSDVLTENPEKETTEADEVTPPVSRPISASLDCRMYKYAPRYGPTEGNEEVLIFYTKKLEESKYGKLRVVFECKIPDVNWKAEVSANDIEVKSQMVSLRTPKFPYLIDTPIPIQINLQQSNRILEPLTYFYISTNQCLTCQTNMNKNPETLIRVSSNKRTKSSPLINDEEIDAMVPSCENEPEVQQSRLVPVLTTNVPSSISAASKPSTDNSATNNNKVQDLMAKLSESVKALFNENDFKPFFRLTRSFVEKQPEWFHNAISKNYFDLLAKFIPVARLDLLQKKNQLGETSLLLAVRLNHVNIVKALLEKETSNTLLEDVNNKKQNIFHTLAMNPNTEEMCSLIIDHMIKKSINISDKFDYIDNENHSPLELAVINKNYSIMDHFLKYFNKNMCKTSDCSGDNLIHVAVRNCDLKMLKLLLKDENLIEQGNQSNLTMTPLELAQSLKLTDLVEYLTTVYRQPQVNEDDDSESD